MTDRTIRNLTERLGRDRVHRPGSEIFNSSVTVWNGAVTNRPTAVVQPRDSREVAAAVIAARECGIDLSVRGGGHDWVGRALRDQGLVIDLGQMRNVRIDGTTAVVGGGALTSDVVAAAGARGFNVATGTAGTVGMAGLSLGGGYGPLLGTAGLAADNLLGAEVVLADGRLVSTDEDPELLWALRGGGGNFGVVTTMRIQLHPDRGLVGGMILFPYSDAAGLLTRFGELLEDAPDELTLLLELTTVPDIGPCVLVVPVWSGDPDHAEAAIDRVAKLGSPLMQNVGPTSQKDLLAQFDQNVPVGMHWDIRPRTLENLTTENIDALLAGAEARPGPGAGIGLRQFHGAAARVGTDDTAFGVRRPHLAVEISGGRGPHDDPASYRSWIDEVSTTLAPHAIPGGYPNFLAPDLDDQIAAAYGNHADRLISAKERYDPAFVFTATPLPTTTTRRTTNSDHATRSQ